MTSSPTVSGRSTAESGCGSRRRRSRAGAPRICAGGNPWHRPQMLSDRDYSIISQYQAEYRGVVQYYLLAADVCHLNRLHWVMETSLLKTLAGKHRSSLAKMARKYKATIDTPAGP